MLQHLAASHEPWGVGRGEPLAKCRRHDTSGCAPSDPRSFPKVARRGYGYFVINIRGNQISSRVLGPLLLFLGTLLLTTAVAVPLALVPRLKVVPLDLDITTVAVSEPAGLTPNETVPARVFDRCSVNEPTLRVFDAHLTQQRRTVVIDPSDADQVTLQSAQTVAIDRVLENTKVVPVGLREQDATRSCDDGLLASSIDVVSLNRRTSVPNGQLNQLHTVPIPSGVPVMESPSTWVDAPREGFQYHFGFEVERRRHVSLLRRQFQVGSACAVCGGDDYQRAVSA